ncbi:chromosome segregation protein SMC [uncultured Amnibacterium sp.]|uniref:chromosome segregation protein SMC n=1 Tax=uncultured Amnibacterium sp. TaxID=1631851 RepID=UPI0035C9B0D9
MHLKRLTMKGFKSFAQATSFVFEPGITAIVGPNGSGKSNVVDALAWVMGEQGAKSLRGGTMADVIFAGTATKSPLGRAEVALTIDNADGALPIEYAEVTVSRTLFRSGASEYAINGESCRLLDVQELLSDSGLGREMHVIVGQGRLDAVLRATPEERRGFVEEAAGILKHRRRKERTERKLESMQANLTRLSDLAGEVRRQLKPLGAQAEVAREAVGIQAEVRHVRASLAAGDLIRLRRETRVFEHERATVTGERHAEDDAVRGAARRAAQLEAAESTGRLDAARRAVVELEGVRERVRGLAQLAASRLALLGGEEARPAPADDAAARDREAAIALVADLQRSVGQAEAESSDAQQALDQARSRLDQVDAARAAAAAAGAAEDRRLADLAIRVRSADARALAADSEAERRASAARSAEERARTARARLVALPPPGTSDAEGIDLVRLEAAVTAALTEADRARDEAHTLQREHDALVARAGALELAVRRPNATAALQAAGTGTRLDESLTVRPGWEAAVAVALGPLTDAALVSDRAAAVAVVDAGSDRAIDLVIDAAVAGSVPSGPPAAGVLPATAVLDAPPGVLAVLAHVGFVPDRAAALAALDDALAVDARAVIVTRAGEAFSATVVRATGRERSRIELVAQYEQARSGAEQAAAGVAAAAARSAAATADLQTARQAMEAARTAVRSAEQTARRAEQERAGVTARAEAAEAEVERLRQQADVACATAARERAAAEQVTALLRAARAEPRPMVPQQQREPAAAALDAAREQTVRMRLELETLRERIRGERRRIDDLDARIAAARLAAEAAARRAATRRLHHQAATAVLQEIPELQASVDRSVDEAHRQLDELERRRQQESVALTEARRDEAMHRGRLAALTERERTLDMRIHEHQVARGGLLERASVELALGEAELLAECGATTDSGDWAIERPRMEQRLRAAERRLAQLGRINPLALEEFAALEQRHAFLTDQLADAERTRQDLRRIIGDLDGRMETIFATAFQDVQDAFERVFPVLFPGGTGRLTLEDAADSIAPGIEVAVRPAGKKIERMSLLSGGERSLAAVAFLIAIFTARPSPFYILDEVEAALDDANLGRLLDVVGSLRSASQLILITHQKRTMEIADALYGISMRQDGVSAVIGQRLAVAG